jgi:dipeptidyl aminopeptidase/acylaminoacyl peptidase
MFRALLAVSLACMSAPLFAEVPDNLVVEGIPRIPLELKRDASRYLEFRTAVFAAWHPVRREMLIGTRFSDTLQLHVVAQPGGARRQVTFLPEPVAGGQFEPRQGRFVVFSQDVGGGEFYQLHRLDLADGRVTLLTDGRSRNGNARFSRDGRWLYHNSTRRNGRDTDVWRLDPLKPESAESILQVQGGGWAVVDVDETGSHVLLQNRRSITDSELHLLDVATRSLKRLTPVRDREVVSYGTARLSRDGRSVWATTDLDSEFLRLVRIDIATGTLTPLIRDASKSPTWDVEAFEVSPDGERLAFVVNENGSSRLSLLDLGSGKVRPLTGIPSGVMTGLEWHENGRDLGFSLAHARSPSDAYSVEVKTGRLTRWTESETGGVPAKAFREPELITVPSFDQLKVSAFVYRPDPARFPGKRPVVMIIHGGPESQSRPGFMARYNYFLNELGIALVVPNVRGSAGYGKRFLTLDDGYLREDSVKDIGAFLDWVGTDPDLDRSRVAVMGGSYGGYMTLASLVHYSDRLRCGVDIVGISNFVTFLTNTQDYRRDLRRVEYGDERDPKMRAHLEKISPLNQADRIRVPLMVVQGKNDPRVPLSEAEQMVKAVRANGRTCAYLMAKDEGHGFAKKPNADFQFLGTILFLGEHLLGGPSVR